MAKCSLIGNPISHSKSPALFEAAYGNGKHTYTLLEASTCKEAVYRFMEEGYTGTNVTSPFKDEVMEYITLPDSISSTLGSVNTIIRKGNELHSYNTDYWGVKNTLLEFIPTPPEDRLEMKALVVGAGGAGKAAALAARDMGMEVYFANRSSHAAGPFAQKIGAEYIPLEMIPSVLESCGLLIYNLSMEIEPLKGASLEGKVVFEANYARPNLSGKGAGKYIDGRYWLYNQAIPAFRLFTGEEPDIAAMKKVMGI